MSPRVTKQERQNWGLKPSLAPRTAVRGTELPGGSWQQGAGLCLRKSPWVSASPHGAEQNRVQGQQEADIPVVRLRGLLPSTAQSEG